MLTFHYFTSMHAKNLKKLLVERSMWRTLQSKKGVSNNTYSASRLVKPLKVLPLTVLS